MNLITIKEMLDDIDYQLGVAEKKHHAAKLDGTSKGADRFARKIDGLRALKAEIQKENPK